MKFNVVFCVAVAGIFMQLALGVIAAEGDNKVADADNKKCMDYLRELLEKITSPKGVGGKLKALQEIFENSSEKYFPEIKLYCKGHLKNYLNEIKEKTKDYLTEATEKISDFVKKLDSFLKNLKDQLTGKPKGGKTDDAAM